MVKINKRVIFFSVIGVANTLVDLSFFVFFHSLRFPVLVANFLSTSIALCFSYVLNKRFTFKSHNTKTRCEIANFLLVTLTGLWVIQPIVIKALIYIDGHIHYSHLAYDIIHVQIDYAIILPKLLATSFSLVWNYLLYSKFVFVVKDDEVTL